MFIAVRTELNKPPHSLSTPSPSHTHDQFSKWTIFEQDIDDMRKSNR